jgi:hypothetical protein
LILNFNPWMIRGLREKTTELWEWLIMICKKFNGKWKIKNKVDESSNWLHKTKQANKQITHFPPPSLFSWCEELKEFRMFLLEKTLWTDLGVGPRKYQLSLKSRWPQ